MILRLVRRFLPLVVLGLTATAVRAADDDHDFPRRKAEECRVRGGLPNLLAKLDAGGDQEIRVAYLGGSITAAPGWRIKTLAWLQKEYPSTKLREINAAIGGTGSDLGVFRLEQDVLRHQPDLLFVEFAVNDGGAPPAQIHQAMEGIVRQTWKASPTTDICFVYTLSLPMLDDMKAGLCSRSASAMEELADFYDIPSIHFGVEVANLEKTGKLIFKGERPGGERQAGEPIVFSTDGVHPLVDTGHQLYLEAFARSFECIRNAASQPGPHELGKPMRADNWEAAKLVPLSEVKLSGDWKTLDPETDPVAKRFARFMPEMRKATTPGASLGFRFTGTVAGIYDLVGPDCGQVVVAIDDRPEKIVKRIDGYCTYARLSKMTLASGLDPGVVHEATVTLDFEVPDKASILFERNRPDLEKSPDKYSGANWYVGSVMLIGQLKP